MGAGLDAFGRWGLSFRKRDDLLFCWIERGACQLTRPLCAPVQVRTGDFVLIRTSTPFTLTSDPSIAPIDSENAVAATKGKRLSLGSGTEAPVTLHAGKFLFDSANQALLMGLLPQLVHIAHGDACSERVRTLLEMNRVEARSPGPGSAFVIVRLLELLLVEILRSHRAQPGSASSGLLAGLADPIAARALAAMHQDVARAWTVGDLATLCAVSRSTFASRFRSVVGTGPIEYLQHWRMALAKDQLRLGRRGVGEIALAIGFQSASAFSTAFTRAVGCSPKQFAGVPDK